MFETFKKSIFSPEFYRAVGETPLAGGLRYYVKCSLFLSLVSVGMFSVALIPYGVHFVRDRAPLLIKEYYPAELVMRVTNGVISVNVPEPYIIPTKEITRHAFKDWRFKNLVVIDTQSDFSKKTFDAYETFALITKREVVTSNINGRVTIQEIPVMANTLIDRDILLAWVGKVGSIIMYLIPLGVALLFLVFLLGYILYLVPLLIFALVPLVVARVKNIPLSYGGAYRMSLYAVVPAVTLTAFLNIWGVSSVSVHLIFLLFSLIILVNLRTPEQPKLF